MAMSEKVRVRFAPSPTGYLHIGGLRTALYNFLLARKRQGDFFLRIEDTDQKRVNPEAISNIVKSLEWAKIMPEEGVFIDKEKKVAERGKYGPYIQSKRLATYQKYAHDLVEGGKAYYCFCTPERLEELRKSQQAAKLAPAYDKRCLKTVSLDEAKKRIAGGEEYVVRFNIPEIGETKFEDIVRGKISFANKNLDDPVILKSDGYPTYHLAHVVDDHLMETTVVIRGEEWLPSTPKHILLFKAFGWEPPRYAHLCVILNKETKRKLSKRDGDVSVEDFVKRGYLSEAVINFIALLGWNPKTEREIFSLEELIEQFDEKKLNRAAAIFDVGKLDWMNGVYIREKNINELTKLCQPYIKDYLKNNPSPDKGKSLENFEYLKKIVSVERERMKKLSDVVQNIDFYFTCPKVNRKILNWKNTSDEKTREALKKARDVLLLISEADWSLDNLKNKLLKAANPKSRGELLWPLRVALTGKEKSPSPFEVAWVIGKKESLKRTELAINTVE